MAPSRTPAAHLYVWALKDIQDLRDALAAAREETSITGRRVLEVIHKNVSIADEQKNLVCQDTGIAVYTCRVGEHFLCIRRVSTRHSRRGRSARRSSIRCARTPSTRSRENTGPNTGYRLPIVHWEFIPEWDGLDVKCVPKGSGSRT